MAKPGVKIELVGDLATMRAFEGMKAGAQRKVTRPAVRAGASIVAKAAQANAKPSEFEDSSGALRRSIGIKTGTLKRQGQVFGVYAVVGARKGEGDREHTDPRGVSVFRRPYKYDHLVEGGTKPHFAGKGGKQFHPGAEAKPFLEPAFEDNRVRIRDAVKTRLALEVDKEARKQAAKARAGA